MTFTREPVRMYGTLNGQGQSSYNERITASQDRKRLEDEFGVSL